MLESIDEAILSSIYDLEKDKSGAIELRKTVIFINPMEIKEIRNKTRLSQSNFARHFGFSLGSYKNWEQDHRNPDKSSANLLRLIGYDHFYMINIFDKILSDKNFATKPEPDEIKVIRNKTEFSQSDFAKNFGFSLGSYKNWEQGHRSPDKSSANLLRLIKYDHQKIFEIMKMTKIPNKNREASENCADSGQKISNLGAGRKSAST